MASEMHWQIAPEYQREAIQDDETTSESDSTVSNEENITGNLIDERDSDVLDGPDLEKAETERAGAAGAPPTRLTTLRSRRTRTSRAETPSEPVGFWHHKMAGVRIHVIQLWLRTTLILGLAIFALLSLFWGAIFKQVDNMHHLNIWVVDFDTRIKPYTDTKPFVGPFVTQSVQRMLEASDTHPGFTIRSPADFNYDPLQVRESVFDFHAWGAVIINANATALLTDAVLTGNASYDPLGACQVIYNSARDQISSFGKAWVSYLLENNTISDLKLSAAPQAISPGIEFTVRQIGLLYLIILSFFSFTFFLPIHMKYLTPKGHPPLHFYQLVIWRYVATVSSYFILSLFYSFVSLSFLMPMSRQPASHVWPADNPNAYGRGTFPVYWMTNWVGMIALGLASENMAMLLGTPWTALWLIFWVVSNVATGFYALPLASGFYAWGYAWPIHNIVEITRQILFDLHPRIGLNFGILFVWCAVGTLLFPLCCYYMRWNTARVKRNAAKKEVEWHAMMEKEQEQPSFLARITTLGEKSTRAKQTRDV
ncbi:hypothetical protein K491DRAFT_709249 [Lophiostoma macrostomum CBS 122681]|uniref:DUF3533 domain-containing protein n=1 Tax=Lophiostoma macrostomum CBS 122681 TaxID=1314788 RepID=A0A6A6SK06_9PLEO|nr:hypothetical protein K491DRAFT_709249 [Lophiostoma macrostomum CBS 122681]